MKKRSKNPAPYNRFYYMVVPIKVRLVCRERGIIQTLLLPRGGLCPKLYNPEVNTGPILRAPQNKWGFHFIELKTQNMH